MALRITWRVIKSTLDEINFGNASFPPIPDISSLTLGSDLSVRRLFERG